MRTIYLLLLVAFTALEESCCGLKGRSKREVLRRSKRRWVLSTIELSEEDPGPYPKEISQMFNNMSGPHEFRISGMGVDKEPLGVFSIDQTTGIVFAHRPIDRETYSLPFHIKFDILDKRTQIPLDKELSFDVEIKDINDNAPTLTPSQMKVDVKENTADGYLPVQLAFSDEDQPNTTNSQVTVSVISQTPKDPSIGLLLINDRLVHLTVKGCFDYDKIKTYQVTVQAKDHGEPSLSSTSVITLNIVDSNTHPPMFKERQYQVEVHESTTIDNVLRVAIEDKDTPETPAWRAIYYFIKGNEDGNYKIETDPNTNEGILSVIKGKDYEHTTVNTLQIGVMNEEAFWNCKDKSPGGAVTPDDSATITVKVIDVNDPPEFKKNPADVHLKEGEKPGKVLFTPEVTDVDSDVSKIRFVLLKDPANWVTIDKKTGRITSAKKMDRESPILNGTDIYKVLIGAIDDGEPPATGTGTVQIHVRDINDNMPELVNKAVIMCGNKANKVMIPVKDADSPPFSGPFSFSLGGNDKSLEERWKLEPAFGEEGGLVSRNTLAYGDYSVPLEIRDQQNMIGRETLEVMVCDCGETAVCRGKRAATAGLGAGGIALIFLGILFFLLLLLLFICDCGRKEFKHIPIVQGEGNQTLIKYNQEGGVSECKAEPNLLLTSSYSMAVTDGRKQGTMQTARAVAPDMDMYNNSRFTMMNSDMTSLGMQRQRDTLQSYKGQSTMNSDMTSLGMQRQRDTLQSYKGQSNMNSDMTSLGMQRQRDTLQSYKGQSNYSKWTTGRSDTYYGGSSRYNGSHSLTSNQRITDHIDRRLNMIDGNHTDHPEYKPYEYAYEGQSSKCQSLDQLSLCDLGNDLTFVNDLGPKFKTLGRICQPTIKGRNTQL